MTIPTRLVEKGIVVDLTSPLSYIAALEEEVTLLDRELLAHRKDQHDKAQGIQATIFRFELKQSALIKKLTSIQDILNQDVPPEQKVASINRLLT